MSDHPFVLADQDRQAQFAIIARTRRLFGDCDVLQDSQNIVWARTSVDQHCFGVSLLGPSWVFDAYARQRRADVFTERRRSMEAMPAEQRQQQLRQIIAPLRLGPLAERILWAIHRRVMQARRSVVRIPDRRLARFVWGPNKAQRPRCWRKTLQNVLAGLTWLHVAKQPQKGPPKFGPQTALLTHTADLKGSARDGCDDDCPELGQASHAHFLFNIGRGFLGILEQFAKPDDKTGMRTYEFKIRGKKGTGPTLRTAGKTGKLINIYLPAKLGDPAQCSKINHQQHDLLQTIVRETTRNTKVKRTDLSEADVISNNKISGTQPKQTITCHLLKADGRYVGFNGNGKRRGLGYGLLTPGGWLVKAGYDAKDIGDFLADLAMLTAPLGLIPVGMHLPTRVCWELNKLQALVGTSAGQQQLRKTHLRIYSSADYVERWNAYFGWSHESQAPPTTQTDPNLALNAAMQRSRLTQRALATAINLDPSFLNKLLCGRRTWPADKLQQAQSWVAEQGADQDDELDREARGVAGQTSKSSCDLAPLMPLLAAVTKGQSSMLAVALAYYHRGWSVIPQNPGAKQPCVKWKPFQERRPTEEELAAWFAQWPQAGLTVVLGPVSGLLVVDVDGSDAHGVLIEHLGSEPRAPKVISGSRQPDRYHLFFQCPDVPTKAKATPWHPKLEFRGQGAVVVIPPSLHPSGNRYEWVASQSIDDLPVPELPAEIVAALEPNQPTVTTSQLATNVDVENASPTTRDFLAGNYAQGPNWNDRLFRAACDLAGRGMAREEAEPLLLAGAQPWNAAEMENARRTIESAFNEPRERAKY